MVHIQYFAQWTFIFDAALQLYKWAKTWKQTSDVIYVCIFDQTSSSAIKEAIQLGIGYTVGNLTSKPDRDVLMQDFYVVESVFMPR